MKAQLINYEFLGIFEPQDKDHYYYVYDVEMEGGIKGRCFWPSTKLYVLKKGFNYYIKYNKDGKVGLTNIKKMNTNEEHKQTT